MQKDNKTGAPDELFELEIGDKKLTLDKAQLLSAAKLGIVAFSAGKGEMPPAKAQQSEGGETLEARMTELEARIEALEQNNKNRQKSTGSARGNAADGELTELEAVYDAVFRR